MRYPDSLKKTAWISCIGICEILYETVFLAGGLDPGYKRNSVEFSVDFRELENLEIMSLSWVSGFRFSNGLCYQMPCGFLDRF